MTILQAVTLLVVAGNTANNDVEDNDEKDDDPSDGNNCYPLLVDNDVDHNSEDDDEDDLSGDNNCFPFHWLSQGIPPTTILTTRMTELLSLCTMSPCAQRAFSKASCSKASSSLASSHVPRISLLLHS